MHIIPVIDIRNGVAVRAVSGRRDDYRPLASPFAPTSAPRDVAKGLAERFAFTTLYIADLDAIEGRGVNRAAIAAIAEALPGKRLWVDSGRERCRTCATIDIVSGSESLEEASALRHDLRAILSLDFLGEAFLGPPELLDAPDLWPQRVIAMALARVGGDLGPDFVRFAAIESRAKGRSLYAAGGVRGVDDLKRLQQSGAAGALVASALHDGRLTPDDLARFESNA